MFKKSVSTIAIFLSFVLTNTALASGCDNSHVIIRNKTAHPIHVEQVYQRHQGKGSGSLTGLESMQTIAPNQSGTITAKANKHSYGDIDGQVYLLLHNGARVKLFFEMRGHSQTPGIIVAEIMVIPLVFAFINKGRNCRGDGYADVSDPNLASVSISNAKQNKRPVLVYTITEQEVGAMS